MKNKQEGKNIRNVPNLRFPEFEGEWETNKLEELSIINPKNENLPSSFIYIDLESVSNGHLLKEVRISNDEAPSRAQRKLERGDILFQMVRPYQKNNLYFDKEGDYVASTGYAQIRTTQNSQFIFQYLHNQKFVDRVIERCTGTSYPAINSSDLGNIHIHRPEINEQKKIAQFLELLDNRIQTQNKIICQLESLIVGVGKDLFAKNIRFSRFKDDWRQTRLDRESEVNPKTGNVSDQFIYIDLESVHHGQLVKKQIMNKSAAPSRAERVLSDGDVLFQCVRPYQMNNFIYFKTDDLQWVASTGYAVIRTKHNSRFIYYLMNQFSFNKEVMIRCTGTSYPAISASDLGEIQIEVCSIDEQNEIAGLLSKVDEKLKLAFQLKQIYETQKKYLLWNLFI